MTPETARDAAAFLKRSLASRRGNMLLGLRGERATTEMAAYWDGFREASNALRDFALRAESRPPVVPESGGPGVYPRRKGE